MAADTEQPPMLRRQCALCGAEKHAIQYHDHRDDADRVCLVCPRCDSPGWAAAPRE